MEKQHINNTDGITLVSKACTEVHGFEEMYRRLERRMNTQRRSESTKKNYARHLAQINLFHNSNIEHADDTDSLLLIVLI